MLASTPTSPHPPGTKRDRTRNRLLAATQQLLKERSAGSIGIRDISHRAELSHATFYNYFDSVEALLDNLAMLFAFTHAQRLAEVTGGLTDVAEIFAVSTRQTLRFAAASPDFGHYMFDAGLRIDHLMSGMREHLRFDLVRGVETATFVVDDIDVTLALVTGSMLGFTLALHRRELAVEAIEPATARLLELLGVAPARVHALSSTPVQFVAAPPIPLQWPVFESADD